MNKENKFNSINKFKKVYRNDDPIQYKIKPTSKNKSKYPQLIGRVFGSLLVQEELPERDNRGSVQWRCLCSGCNSYCVHTTYNLLNGLRTTCGCRTRKHNSVYSTTLFNGFSPTLVNKYREIADGLKTTNDNGLLFKVLLDYANGASVPELSNKYELQTRFLYRYISELRTKINQTYEIRYLESTVSKVPVSPDKLNKVLATRFTTEELGSYVSSDTSTELTDEESLYCLMYAKTGSNSIALKDSGLIEALKLKDPVRQKLLGLYLRAKPNLKAYIQKLNEEEIEELIVSKPAIQVELTKQIVQLKELVDSDNSGPVHRSQLLKSIELLGKTIGAFQDNLKIEEISPSEALDKLIEMKPVESEYSVKDE